MHFLLVNVSIVCYHLHMNPTTDKKIERKELARLIRYIVDNIKVATGCQIQGVLCMDTHSNFANVRSIAIASAYEFDHINPATKYRTKSGNLVHLADMVKGARYSLATILAEIAKCRVACTTCHRLYTHQEQRVNV